MSTPLHSPAEILAQVLVDAALASDVAIDPAQPWPVFISHRRHDNDQLIALYDTEPLVEGRLLQTGASLRQWGVQVVVRCAADGYSAGWHKIIELVEWLEQASRKPAAFEDGSFVLHSVDVESGPMTFGKEEETRRPLFSANVLLRIGMTS